MVTVNTNLEPGLALGTSSNSLLSSDLSTCQECRKFQKTPQKVKKKLHVTVLKMNSLHSPHLMCQVLNSQCVEMSTRHPDSTRRCQFTLGISNLFGTPYSFKELKKILEYLRIERI